MMWTIEESISSRIIKIYVLHIHTWLHLKITAKIQTPKPNQAPTCTLQSLNPTMWQKSKDDKVFQHFPTTWTKIKQSIATNNHYYGILFYISQYHPPCHSHSTLSSDQSKVRQKTSKSMKRLIDYCENYPRSIILYQ